MFSTIPLVLTLISSYDPLRCIYWINHWGRSNQCRNISLFISPTWFLSEKIKNQSKNSRRFFFVISFYFQSLLGSWFVQRTTFKQTSIVGTVYRFSWMVSTNTEMSFGMLNRDALKLFSIPNVPFFNSEGVLQQRLSCWRIFLPVNSNTTDLSCTTTWKILTSRAILILLKKLTVGSIFGYNIINNVFLSHKLLYTSTWAWWIEKLCKCWCRSQARIKEKGS